MATGFLECEHSGLCRRAQVGGWGYNLLFISACVRLCVCVWCVCACVCVCVGPRALRWGDGVSICPSLSLSLSRCCWCRHKRLVDEANRRPRPRQSIKATVPSPRKTATDEVRPPLPSSPPPHRAVFLDCATVYQTPDSDFTLAEHRKTH